MTIRIRILLDFLAVGLFVAGLAYWWQDNLTHEVIGTIFFALLIAHNVFNRRWYGTVKKGRYDPPRTLNTIVIAGMAISMLILLGTSILISQDVFAALALDGAFAVRAAHMFVAYWALVFLAVHLGTRWQMVMNVTRQALGIKGTSPLRTWTLRAATAIVAVKGVLATLEMGLGTKLRFEYALDMWDFNESTLGFFANYLSIIGLYAALTCYGLTFLRERKRRKA
ncbi:DUF4405 domain-containing protein [Paracoccus denitrificans]|jgi:hypothetical protein|uniref:Flavinylation-associated cytochrome domain-containing protein n=1 Tax=Paracoccus denitrificans (strain Pd 1222) TaxID=318586 RepID=A1B726_PARDP|nr:DUF4405 domain-containing protein [Paracoccus denitrificans]ABL71320.1 conserved hypothetical protein [Paracoccus denitrificans PD1222]MBB4629941.1 hypothetical protein [Paracoccus denitrificans]MCU7431330.1 DUF4405 domain-containing protein [Paracoccus denitrificans]QAR27947.1 DUF4405 domain-containing protein [Paracoccus denitrificans]UPV97663.1 DUF4405 domain-containing protein [Paracoccus denitrificans]